MVLAAISFADPLMLAGLIAALVPVALHLLNRMRAPVVAFPTLRFLKLTAQKTARRRHIQQYFLLLVRVIVFALVAMAVAAPLIRGGSAPLAYGFVGMLLLGLGLLVLGLVLSSSAMEGGGKSKNQELRSKKQEAGGSLAAAARAARGPAEGASGSGGRDTRFTWAVAVLALVLAVLLGGYSAYGLVSERFFSSAMPGEFSGQSTAMVIIFDNSHSMLAKEGAGGAGETRLARAKGLVRELVGEKVSPREAALLPTNPGAMPGMPAFTTNMFVLAGQLEKLTPEGGARPMAERIRTGLEMLGRSEMPGKMLVIVSDFARPGYSDVEVFGALKSLKWPGGGRGDLQVVLLPVRGGGAVGDASVADVGIVRLGLAEGTQRPVVGAEVTFEAEVVNNASAGAARDLEFLVDGNVVGARGGPLNPPVQLGAAGSGTGRLTLRLPLRLTDAGPHRFGVRLAEGGGTDAMAWDDTREMALEVAEEVKVLVVGGEGGAGGGPRARSAGFYLMAALAPFEGMKGPDGKPVPWSVKPVYRGIDQVPGGAQLAGYAAVFMCDVPRVPAALADGLVAYVKGGGRVVWVLGPSVDSSAYNQVLLGPGAERGGARLLLPGPLGVPVVAAKAQVLDWVDVRSGVFMNLFDSQEPFRNVLVTGRWTVTENAVGGSGRTLAKLADGSPLFVQHGLGGGNGGGGGAGQIFTLLTTPGAEWSNLGATVLLVPLASRMALGDFQESGSSGTGGSFETGQAAELRAGADAAALRGLSVDVTVPGGAVVNVKPGATAGQWTFERTLTAGMYAWKTSDGKFTGMFTVNPPGAEADLVPADVEALAKESSLGLETAGGGAGKATIVAYGVPELLGQLEHRAEGTSLMPGFLSMVLMLAVVEAMLANRHKAT